MPTTTATPANMRAYADAHPARKVQTPDGEATIIAAIPCALDLATGETFAASAGDYWQQPDDEPLRGEDGEPMVLVVPFSGYRDALTGEVV